MNPISLYRESNSATYIKVAEFCGLQTNDSEEAKRYLSDIAKKENLKVSDLFDGYNNALEHDIRDRNLSGFFDY